MIFNTYLKNLDYSHIKDLCVEKGKLRTYRKKDFFICQNEIERFAGWVKEGIFQYTYIDEEGEEHIVGYSFTNEFVCDYSSFMKGCLSLVNIQAIADCSVYEISRHDLIEYLETNMETQRFGRYVAENRNHSIFRHDNFIGCFSADKIKMPARKYFCFNIPVYKNMVEEPSCRSPYHKEYIRTGASGNPEDLCH